MPKDLSDEEVKARFEKFKSRRGSSSKNCSHSFNNEGKCEYCGISEEEFQESPNENNGRYE